MLIRAEIGKASNENGWVWSVIGRSGPGQASEVVVVGVDDPTPSTAVMHNSMTALYKSLAGWLTSNADCCALAQNYTCDDHAARVQG